MQWLSPTLLAIQVISALVIIVLVLLQQGKGSEMGAAFGSGSAGSLFGSSGAANFLSRSTKWAAILFFATTGALAYMAHHPHSRGFDGGVMQGFKSAPAKAPEAPATPAPASAVPAVPTAPAQNGASSQSSGASSSSSSGSASSVPSAGASGASKSSSSGSVPSVGAAPASGDKTNAQSGSQAAPAANASGATTPGTDKQSDAGKK